MIKKFIKILNDKESMFKRIFCVFLLFVFIISCQQQVDWTTYRGIDGSGATSNSIYTPLGQRWKLILQKGQGDIVSFNPPIIQGETVYFGSNDHNFYALDARSGYMRWIFPTKNKVNSIPFIYEDTIYFGSNDGYVYALDLKTGEKKWAFQTSKTVQSLVYRYENDIIFTSDLGLTYFLSPKGAVKNTLANPTWSHHTFQVYDGVVYWAPLKDGFGAYDIKKRRFLWQIPVQFGVPLWFSFAALDHQKVYYASSRFTGRGNGASFKYYALDRKTGRTLWKKNAEFEWSPYVLKNSQNAFFRYIYMLDYLAPSLWKDLVIYTSGDSVVRAFHKDDGHLVWEKRFDYHTSSAPTIAGNRVYFGVYGNESNGLSLHPSKLVCLSVKDGSLLWEMDVEGAVLSAPVISGKRLLFGTEKNRFYILEEIF